MASSLRFAWTACALSLSMWATVARAQEGAEPSPAPRPDGLRAAVRTGAAVVVSNERTTGLTSSIPVRLDLLRRSANSVIDIGATFELGPTWGELLGYSAQGTRGRAGILAVAHFRKGQRFDPWLAMGGGLELRTAGGGGDQVRVDYDRFGIELARLELGADLPLGGGTKLAPTFETAFGRYVLDFDKPSNPLGGEVHASFGLGLRGSYDF